MKLVRVAAVVAFLTIAACSALVGSASASEKAQLPHGLGARPASTSVTSSVTFASSSPCFGGPDQVHRPRR